MTVVTDLGEVGSRPAGTRETPADTPADARGHGAARSADTDAGVRSYQAHPWWFNKGLDQLVVPTEAMKEQAQTLVGSTAGLRAPAY